LLVDIYSGLRPVSAIPFQSFSQIAGINMDALKAFEDHMLAKESQKEKLAVARSFLADIIGVLSSDASLKCLSYLRKRQTLY
jgi:hypothetical protein